jgi:hypothetical protein
MNDSLFARRADRPQIGNGHAEPDSDGEDNLGAFGWLRGIRDRAIMLEVHKKDGNIIAFGYAWLERADFDPSEGITLKFTGHKVKIVGRNLNAVAKNNARLFNGIMRHRVPWIQEAGEPEQMEAPGGATVIEEVVIE